MFNKGKREASQEKGLETPMLTLADVAAAAKTVLN